MKKGKVVYFNDDIGEKDCFYPPWGTVGVIDENNSFYPFVVWRGWKCPFNPERSAVSAKFLTEAIIEPGDTVRICKGVTGDEHLSPNACDGLNGVVTEVINGSDKDYRVLCGKTMVFVAHGFADLVRKARKPEIKNEKKEERTMKSRLKDINERTLVKLRADGMCAVLAGNSLEYGNTRIFHNKSSITCGFGGISPVSHYNSDLTSKCERQYDIVAVKQCNSQSQAIAAVLSGTEPAWDWTEEQERKPQKGDWVEYSSDRYGTPRNKKGRGIVEVIEDGYALVETECGSTLVYYFSELRLIDPPAPVVLPAADVLRELSPKYGPRVSIKFPEQTVEL